MGWTVNGVKLFNGIMNLLKADIKSPLTRSLLSFSLVLIHQTYNLFTLGDNYFSQSFEQIINDKRQIPSLFLYSKNDKLISYKDIQAKILLAKKNRYVREKLYEDADHVLIYQKYQQDYLNEIKSHLKQCNILI
jgi:fermentation-respiration switch protein FrsA (DUF1100 family)